MKIWWCQELDDDCGMFVVANTPSKAKYLYSQEAGCQYTDVRYHCVVKDADAYKEETLPDTKDIVLQRHGLHYFDEYYQPIKNHDCLDTTLVAVKPVVEEEEFVYYGQVNYFGYEEAKIGKTTGSAVCFVNKKLGSKIRFHKPHPEHYIKKYLMKQIKDSLEKEGLI